MSSIYQKIIETLLLLALVGFAVSTIGEIVARQQFQALVDRQITDLQAQYIEISTDAPNDSKQLARVDRVLFELKRLRTHVNTLNAIGAEGYQQTLPALRWRETRIGSFGVEQLEPTTKESESYDPYGSHPGAFREFVAIVDYIFYALGLNPSFAGTDHLLAIAIVSCGAIGSLIAGLRADTRMTFRNLSLGIAAGFVTFLAVKGSKHIFLVQLTGDPVAFNPYSTAFAGLLAGLFTERVYRLLSMVAEQFAKRIEAAIKG